MLKKEFKLIVGNNSDDYSMVTGYVYEFNSTSSIPTISIVPIGSFVLETKKFPRIGEPKPNTNILGNQFITKYEFNFNLGQQMPYDCEKCVNLYDFNFTGTYKLNSGTFFNLSPFGIPYGKYFHKIHNSVKIVLDISKCENQDDEYQCVMTWIE